MPKILLYDLFVEIRHSLGRFLSIMMIVALGVAFFSGIKASAPDMKHSADAYFDSYHVQDIQLYSTVGIDQENLDAIKKLDGVEGVQGQFSMDALTRKDSREQVVKVITFQEDQSINQPRLVEGRLPKEPDECLIEADNVNSELFESYMLGDRIRLYSGTDTPITDTLDTSTFIIVGKAYNPNYLSYEKGTSSVGSGSVDTFIYILQDALKVDYFTEADITVAGASKEDMYSEAYFDKVDPVIDELESIEAAQVGERIAKAQKEMDDARKEVQDQLDEARGKLENSAKELSEGAAEIAGGLKEISANESLLASSRAQYEAGLASYYNNKNLIDSSLSQVDQGLEQITQAQNSLPSLQAQKAELEQAIQMWPMLNNAVNTIASLQSGYEDLLARLDRLEQENPDDPQIPALKEKLAEAQAALDQAIANFTGDPSMSVDGAIAWIEQQRNDLVARLGSPDQARAMLEELNAGILQIESLSSKESELKATRNQLLAAQSELAGAWQTLENARARLESGQAELSSAKSELSSAQKQLEDGKKQYDEGKKEFDEKEKEANSQIEEAQKKVDDMDGSWIILDRNSHYSYRDYQSCADRMDGIASIFPVFFFLVAALVCMTTMTRMVDEQRNEIGTLKALGYSKFQIAGKYLGYAGLASIGGCILGCSIGMILFPWVIFTAWNTMYNLESIQFTFQPDLILLASLSVTAIVLGATLASIGKELMEVPSQLMRPKAAKAGSKILLERIPWLWRRFSFMHKVTLRNLFRYKKRFLMTVIGISGCSALLVAGFGLNDSISSIVSAQFEDIYHYNATVTMDPEKADEALEQIAKMDGVKSVYKSEILPVTLEIKDKDMSGNLNILEKPEAFSDFMTFHWMDGSSESQTLKDNGVYISIKMAEDMGISAGDSISFTLADDQKIETTVSGIFDQYIGHQIYVTRTLFDTWNVALNPNISFLLKNTSKDADFENDLGTKLMNVDGTRSIEFYSSLEESFLNMIASIKMVVVVLILSAAMLAFVVLYNLSNVNISERVREIATIKVLGFTEKEVNAYVNRESIILAVIGAFLGLGLGIWLHGMIMSLAELDDVRFGRTILPASFAIAFILTIVFAFAVNWIMKKKLAQIEMVESLKAIE